MAERALPQGRQHNKQQTAQCGKHQRSRASFCLPAGAQKRTGCPLHGKAEQRVPPKPLEGGGQHPAQRLEEDADPGDAVGKRNDGAIRGGNGIRQAQRERPMRVAEQHPARIMLLNVPLIIAVQDPGIIGWVQGGCAIQQEKYHHARRRAQKRRQPPPFCVLIHVFYGLCSDRSILI